MMATRRQQKTEKSLPLTDYQSLAELRYQIRRFVHFSEQAVRNAGLEPRQHQLMLALKALPKGVRPRIGELAERLLIQHHSAVELVNRLATGGYVRRGRGDADRREVLLSLTPKGAKDKLNLHSFWDEILEQTTPNTADLCESDYLDPIGDSPDSFGRFIPAESAKLSKIAKDVGAHVD